MKWTEGVRDGSLTQSECRLRELEGGCFHRRKSQIKMSVTVAIEKIGNEIYYWSPVWFKNSWMFQ